MRRRKTDMALSFRYFCDWDSSLQLVPMAPALLNVVVVCQSTLQSKPCRMNKVATRNFVPFYVISAEIDSFLVACAPLLLYFESGNCSIASCLERPYLLIAL